MPEIPPPPAPYVPTAPVAPRRRSALVGFLVGALSVGALAGGVAIYSAQADDTAASVVIPAALPADPSSTQALPPKVQGIVECLKSNGIEMPSVEARAGGGGSFRWNFPGEGDLRAAVESCMPEGAKIGLGEVMGTRPDGSTIELPQLPDEIKSKIEAFQKCLADNGVTIEPQSGARPDVEKLKSAAEACGGVIGLGAGRPGR